METTNSVMSTAYESLGWPRIVLTAATLAVACWYMVWRIGTLNPDAPIFSVILFAAEAFGILTLLLHVFMVRRLTVREAPLPAPGHTVDIFIPTIDEPVDVVRRTAIKALGVDYPHETYILDDGNRPEIRALAEEIGCRYLARGSNEHAKAGNLNYGLQHSSGEFIALFDADHAPMHNFLLRTLGYFNDPNVAFVQTPQDFYNLDSYQHHTEWKKGRIWSEQSLFFRVIQRGKDYWNAAFFCGCCAIIRRSALEAIGGFATGTVTEDIHTSIRLHKKEYTSIYHAESLAYGIAPAQVEPFLRQRIRWGQGAMQVWRQETIILSPDLTVAQKINYLASMITYFDGWQKFIFYVTPAVVLFTGWVPIKTNAPDFLLHFVPYFIMMMWCFEELGRGYTETLVTERYNMIRFAAFCLATVGLFVGNIKFRVTNKKMTNAESGRWYLLPQYGVLLLNAVAIPIGLIFNAGLLPTFALSANLMWATVNLTLVTIVLAFSLRRRRWQRNNYRFSIPLVARLQTAYGHESLAVIDNLSCAGLLLVASRELGIKTGDIISGTLYLPEGPIPFQAKARAMHNHWEKSLTARAFGCEFIWNDHAARTRIEQFLYGSDLEWQIHNLTEKGVTVLEWVFGASYRYKPVPLSALPNTRSSRLSSMVLKQAGDRGEVVNTGIISVDQKNNRSTVMVFYPLLDNKPFEATLFTPDGWRAMRAKVANRNIVNHPSPHVYLYQLENIPA